MQKLPALSTLEECPYCGYDEYYYMQYVKGKISFHEKFDSDSEESANNTEMWDGVNYGKKLKTIHCANCHKKIAMDDSE